MKDIFDMQYAAPEHRLWFAVLATYVIDTEQHCKDYFPRCVWGPKTTLLTYLYSEGTEAICEMLDIDYENFATIIQKRAKESCHIHKGEP